MKLGQTCALAVWYRFGSVGVLVKAAEFAKITVGRRPRVVTRVAAQSERILVECRQ